MRRRLPFPSPSTASRLLGYSDEALATARENPSKNTERTGPPHLPHRAASRHSFDKEGIPTLHGPTRGAGRRHDGGRSGVCPPQDGGLLPGSVRRESGEAAVCGELAFCSNVRPVQGFAVTRASVAGAVSVCFTNPYESP